MNNKQCKQILDEIFMEILKEEYNEIEPFIYV